MFHIPLEAILTLGPVFGTVVALYLIELTGVRVGKPAGRSEVYLNRNACWTFTASRRPPDIWRTHGL